MLFGSSLWSHEEWPPQGGTVLKTNWQNGLTDNMKYGGEIKEILTVKVRMKMKYSWKDKQQGYLYWILLNAIILFQFCPNISCHFYPVFL